MKSKLGALMLSAALLFNSFNYLVAKNITRGNKNFKEIALTFDCHWHDTTTPKVLDILKKKNVKATFFLTGDYIKRCPKVVKRIYNEGYEIGSHFDKHIVVKNASYKRLEKLLKGVDEKLYKLVGIKTHYCRAPYGAVNSETIKKIEKAGYTHIYWTIDTRDWEIVPKEKAEERRNSIEEKIYKDLKNGAIILLHPRTRVEFCEHKLEPLIDNIKKRGYSLVTISQILNDRQDY
jgi:peptidoglycan/xylan/chitin deacetylase (PgdA/CDA1 family)